MKLKHIFFLPFIIMLAASCTKPKNDTVPFTVPTGNFNGTFQRLRYNASTSKYDTLTTAISLSMDLTTGYKITGDTTLHAGSYGNFTINAYYIGFDDATFSGTELPAKPHLVGTYAYSYNGTQLHMQQTYPSDTLGFFYDLTKVQ